MKKFILSAGLFLLLFLAFNAQGAAIFGGVGIDGAPLRDGEIVVKQLVASGPASRAGIRKGDIITAIDDRPTKGSNFREMVEKRLRGHEGTKVRLTIRRPGLDKPLRFTLVRRKLIVRGR